MTKVYCKDCLFFKSAPYEARKTGCWNLENMPQKHTEAYLDEQQIPGDQRAINLSNDCPQYAARPRPAPWPRRLLKRLLAREEPLASALPEAREGA